MASKYDTLLEDRQVQRWYGDVSRGAKSTGDVYLRKLGWFCEANGMTPSLLARMHEKDLFNLLIDTVEEFEQKGRAGSYTAKILNAVRSWLQFNDVRITRRIRVRGAQDTPSLRTERVPTQSELRQVMLLANEKERVICSLMSQAGLST